MKTLLNLFLVGAVIALIIFLSVNSIALYALIGASLLISVVIWIYYEKLQITQHQISWYRAATTIAHLIFYYAAFNSKSSVLICVLVIESIINIAFNGITENKITNGNLKKDNTSAKLFILVMAIVSLHGCKKKDISTPAPVHKAAPMTVIVSGLTNKTSVSVVIRCKSNSKEVLHIGNPELGNQTYTTEPINFSEYVYVSYASNVPCNNATGDGKGKIEFIYNGRSIAPLTGCLLSSVTGFSVF